MHTLNPQKIVFDNALIQFSPWLGESLQQSLESRFSYLTSFRFQVDYSRLGGDSCAFGAASSVIQATMSLQ